MSPGLMIRSGRRGALTQAAIWRRFSVVVPPRGGGWVWENWAMRMEVTLCPRGLPKSRPEQRLGLVLRRRQRGSGRLTLEGDLGHRVLQELLSLRVVRPRIILPGHEPGQLVQVRLGQGLRP